jgi:hypothetical protein
VVYLIEKQFSGECHTITLSSEEERVDGGIGEKKSTTAKYYHSPDFSTAFSMPKAANEHLNFSCLKLLYKVMPGQIFPAGLRHTEGSILQCQGARHLHKCNM